MRFENRVLESWLEEKVSSYFLCSTAALDVVPVCSGRNFVDVVVKWEDGQKWLIRCFPYFDRNASPPSISSLVDMARVAMILKAKPSIGYVSENRVEMVWNKEEVAPPPYEKAA